MSATLHSPGPWRISADRLREANGALLYRLTPLDEITIAQDDANRRLIESGPALAEFVAKVSRTAEGGPYPVDCLHAIVTDARALLAKLEGST